MGRNEFDIIVIGAGHAGCEAALAAARMGCRCALVTMDPAAVARMSCNPAIGGPAKGQLAREVDALGGEMGKAIDAAHIQFRMLNTGKGPAVRAPRAQADRESYHLYMRNVVENQAGLRVITGMVEAIETDGGRVKGLTLADGTTVAGKCVVVTTGTFLRGVIHTGTETTGAGRDGEPPSIGLSESLESLGLQLGRLKTGTPPRLAGRTIDFSSLQIQKGDERPGKFSYFGPSHDRPDIPCYITYTSERTHEIIRSNLDRAPLYTGQITAVGPRYCPSLETKIVRFPDAEHHRIFLEPEGENTDEFYCNGIATSIPRDVQVEMVHSIPGLERATITKYGYAIEYDYVPPVQLGPWLETRAVANLFLAGQINGTSGYEEAAGQGIVAGINAALRVRGEDPFILDRSQAYIGVLIDDLVTCGTEEPYRMFTSLAEYRLLLRQDNADRRLSEFGYKFGLVSEKDWKRVAEKNEKIARAEKFLQKETHQSKTLAEILRRPGTTFAEVAPLSGELSALASDEETVEQIEIETKYEGYIRRQAAAIEAFKKNESLRLPDDIRYEGVYGISSEAREKLGKIRPLSIGQASRISGISPADITALLVHLRRARHLPAT
jgi:tRNA uridine 5-carboxymethylaminomethyl modification enzyme